MQKIAQNVYVETGYRGCNVSFVTTTDGVLMIDTPMVPSESLKWRSEITKFGPVRYVINNEPHYDHISGSCFFDGKLVTQEGTRDGILGSSVEELVTRLKTAAPEDLPVSSEFHFRPPDITFSQRLTLYLGSHTFQLLHLPGHTPGQTAVYVPEERVVFTSDNVVNPGPPYLHMAVPYAWLESLKKIGELDVDRIIPGHGAICDKSYLPKMSATIQNWIDRVGAARRQGMSVAEAREQLTVQVLFPNMPPEPRLEMIKRMNITHLYEAL
jgi:cyclase